jgi:hypothetical protein
MAWNRRETEEKPNEELNEIKSKFGELETKLSSSVPKEEFESLKAKNEELSNTLAGLQTQLTKLNRFTEPEPATDDPTTDMITDPRGFISRETANDRGMMYQTRADLQEMRARQKHAAVFKAYEKDLMAMTVGFSVQDRSNPNFWDIHVERVLGNKMLKGEIKVGSYPSLMGAGAGSSSENTESNLGLEAFEVEYAHKRGIPLEKAAKMKSIIKSGEKISLENARA